LPGGDFIPVPKLPVEMPPPGNYHLPELVCLVYFGPDLPPPGKDMPQEPGPVGYFCMDFPPIYLPGPDAGGVGYFCMDFPPIYPIELPPGHLTDWVLLDGPLVKAPPLPKHMPEEPGPEDHFGPDLPPIHPFNSDHII
jgi:hypothetical protein